MDDRETVRMRKYGESKTTRIMVATVPHVTSGLGLRKFQADGFLLTRVYMYGYPLGLQEVETPRNTRQSSREGGKVVSPTHRPPLPPGTHFY